MCRFFIDYRPVLLNALYMSDRTFVQVWKIGDKYLICKKSGCFNSFHLQTTKVVIEYYLPRIFLICINLIMKKTLDN